MALLSLCALCSGVSGRHCVVRGKSGLFRGACAEQSLLPARRAPACMAQAQLRRGDGRAWGPFLMPLGMWGHIRSVPLCWLQASRGSRVLTSSQGCRCTCMPSVRRFSCSAACEGVHQHTVSHLFQGLPASVAACPRDAVRPRVTCVPDGLAPCYLHFSRQSFVFLLLLFLISSGHWYLPISQFHTTFPHSAV